jgi:hypothetical protein
MKVFEPAARSEQWSAHESFASHMAVFRQEDALKNSEKCLTENEGQLCNGLLTFEFFPANVIG